MEPNVSTETQAVTPIDNIDSLVDSDQPGGLLSYLRGQEFQAAPASLVVNEDGSVAPQELDSLAETQNTSPAVATTQGQPVGPTTQPAVLSDVEKQRYDRAIADLQQQLGTERQTSLRIAQAARQQEDAMFESSLKDMEPELADVARAKHEAKRAKEEAQFFRGQYESKVNEETGRTQAASKQLAAYKLAQALQLPQEDVESLMTAETTHGMLAMAKTLASVRGANPAKAQAPVQPTQQVVNPAVLAAGGEQAPQAPPKRVEQRKGDLLGMMRERPYTNVAVG